MCTEMWSMLNTLLRRFYFLYLLYSMVPVWVAVWVGWNVIIGRNNTARKVFTIGIYLKTRWTNIFGRLWLKIFIILIKTMPKTSQKQIQNLSKPKKLFWQVAQAPLKVSHGWINLDFVGGSTNSGSYNRSRYLRLHLWCRNTTNNKCGRKMQYC